MGNYRFRKNRTQSQTSQQLNTAQYLVYWTYSSPPVRPYRQNSGYRTHIAGCDGPVGPPGPPGNANVFSHTIVFSIHDAVINGSVASAQFDVPDITGSVVDEGAVLVFFREQNTWTAMPYTFGVESPDLPAVDYTITLGFAFEWEYLELFYEASTDAVDLSLQPDRTVKIVIIDGLGFGKTGIDLTNYEAVKAFYGLED